MDLFRSLIRSTPRTDLQLRFVLGQDLDLFREEPAVRFCYGDVGGAFERGACVLPPSESAQDRPASRMQQVIVRASG